MRTLKNWYEYKRNGIYYFQFKDKITGKKLTAKSTHTRNKEEALQIINELYYNPESSFNKSQAEKHKDLFLPIIQESIKSVLDNFMKLLPKTTAYNVQTGFIEPINTLQPKEISSLASKLDSIDFFDYILLFWDYENSPYIKQLLRLGKNIPNPERFNRMQQELKRYKNYFITKPLKDISVDEINTILGNIKQRNKLKDSTMSFLRSAFTQPLNFLYKNNLTKYDISKKITVYSNQNEKKSIFTEDELKILFGEKTNHFKKTKYLLLNKLLLTTGCRVGEIIALKIKDIQKTSRGYTLNINKSYCKAGKRIKETKTGREDTIFIPENTALEINEFIKTNPFNKSTDAFIFYSDKTDKPIPYNSVYENFNQTIKKLGFNRKNLTLHSYRHTYATSLANAGYSQLDLLYLTRHESLEEIKRYTDHITSAHEQKNIEAAHLIEQIIT